MECLMHTSTNQNGYLEVTNVTESVCASSNSPIFQGLQSIIILTWVYTDIYWEINKVSL